MQITINSFKTAMGGGIRLLSACAVLAIGGCADVDVPDPRNVSIDKINAPNDRLVGINETRDPIVYVPLGKDVLIPDSTVDLDLPADNAGPYELRSETLAGALQLILADYDIPLSFETEEGLNRRVTVSNLSGPLPKVIETVCSIADLYCAYDDGMLIVKDSGTFTVSLPPIGESADFEQIAGGLEQIIGSEPVVDNTTRTIIYNATQRTAKLADKYFRRLRASTALIVFETHIWEVQLSSTNRAGVRWDNLDTLGKYNVSLDLPGGAEAGTIDPITIGLPTTGDPTAAAADIFSFLSEYGAVKTISQPQISVLSGSSASLRVAETRNYISELSRTIDDTSGNETVSTSTGQVDTGLNLEIQSNWDQATVYGNISIELQQFIEFETFAAGNNDELRLPRTSERNLETSLRVRPGDSILIAGIVTERDDYNNAGVGIMRPILPGQRSAGTENTELVFLLRPRVVVYTDEFDPEAIKNAGQRLFSEGQNTSNFPVSTIDPSAMDPGAR